MRAMLDDPTVSFKLKVKLASLVDFADKVVKTCYRLEGDGPLVLTTYDIMKTLEAHFLAPSFPNVHALVRNKYPDNEQASQIVTWTQYAMACVQPSIDYFVAL